MNRTTHFKRFLGIGLAVVGLGLAGSASAQQAGGAASLTSDIIRIRKMTPSTERTPIYRTTSPGNTSTRARDWWRVVVEFETRPDWIDELEFTYYAYVKDQSNKNAEVMFRGGVTYVNIPKGRHLSDMFLHPGTLERMGRVEQVAVVVKHKGAVVAIDSTAQTPNWWERFSPLDGVLLNRAQTPFAFIDFDLFNAIKPAATTR